MFCDDPKFVATGTISRLVNPFIGMARLTLVLERITCLNSRLIKGTDFSGRKNYRLGLWDPETYFNRVADLPSSPCIPLFCICCGSYVGFFDVLTFSSSLCLLHL